MMILLMTFSLKSELKSMRLSSNFNSDKNVQVRYPESERQLNLNTERVKQIVCLLIINSGLFD